MIDTDDLFDLYQVDNQGSESFTEYIIGMMNNYVEELKRLREEVNTLNEIIDTERKKVYDIAQKLLEAIE
jgi:hypothetical protein|tara:strand:+ start:220 stop:429 length:210 start_codon:yes stop_codon:yes gene_type:complete